MNVSIVIPAYNESKLLPGTLEAVRAAAAAFDERGLTWECVVCDNNSTDGTGDVARRHGVKVVFEPVNQISRSRNAGAAAATGEWLLFVDADSRPSRALFADVAALLADGDVLFAGATVALDIPKIPPGAWAGLRLWNLVSRMLTWVAGSFVLVESAAFREIGGFSAKFYAGEELDLSRRLKRVARRRGKRGVILSRHPLVTSARRMTMYSGLELARFFLKAALRPWSTTSSREACAMWYDGRR